MGRDGAEAPTTNLLKIMEFLKRIILVCLSVLICSWGMEVYAGELSDRFQQFPNWKSKPSVEVATGDLAYPQWMAGEWLATSTLVDLAAPLSPQIVTPGFEKNRQYLNQPIQFKVRFVPENSTVLGAVPYPFLQSISQQKLTKSPQIVGDRAYNGMNIAKAILGDGAVLSVKVDPQNPNRQITQLKGDRQLITVVTGRSSETLNPNQFVATEISQQIFQGENLIYLNEVETTTSYQVHWDEITPSKVASIFADQITAIYLSPQDPDYFTAAGHPVALYRYKLQLLPI